MTGLTFSSGLRLLPRSLQPGGLLSAHALSGRPIFLQKAGRKLKALELDPCASGVVFLYFFGLYGFAACSWTQTCQKGSHYSLGGGSPKPSHTLVPHTDSSLESG